MPTYKATFVFNQGRLGWSESWYLEQSNSDFALAQAGSLAALRQKLLASGVNLEYIRVSDVAIAGDANVKLIDEWGTTQIDGADTPWNAIYVRIQAGDQYRRQMWLRGVPDAWIAPTLGNPASNVWPGALTSALDKFVAKLKNVPFKLKVISKDTGDIVEKDITSITEDGSHRIVFGIAGLTGAVNDTFRVKKFSGPDKAQLNGVYTIVSNSGTAVVVPKKYADLESPPEDSGGKAVARVIKYKDITDGTLIRLAKRNTGRAFFAPAGRRRARK